MYLFLGQTIVSIFHGNLRLAVIMQLIKELSLSIVALNAALRGLLRNYYVVAYVPGLCQ